MVVKLCLISFYESSVHQLRTKGWELTSFGSSLFARKWSRLLQCKEGTILLSWLRSVCFQLWMPAKGFLWTVLFYSLCVGGLWSWRSSVECGGGEVVCLGYTASFHHHLVSLAVWNLRLVFLVLVAEVNTLSATLFGQRKPVGVIRSDLQHFCSYSNEFRHFYGNGMHTVRVSFFYIVYSFWMYTVYVWKYLITQTASRVFVVRFTCTSDVMAGYFTLRDCTEKSWRTT